jgi:hypothetical protein
VVGGNAVWGAGGNLVSALTGTKISEDLRYELVDAARVAEMSNRPRSLLVLATALFLVAGVVLMVTLGARERAVGQFRVQSDRQTMVAGLVQQFEAVERIRQQGGEDLHGHLPNLFSLIEQAATDAGLRSKPPIPNPRSSREAGGIRYVYDYTIRDPSLGALLDWVQRARVLVPGLQVSSIEIQPQPKEWQFDVTFVRWERPS